MTHLIFINGAPGTGKSTTCWLLKNHLNSPFIEFSDLRIWHLNREWTNQSPEEEQMAFENLVFVLNNYVKYGFKNVIVTDFEEFRIQQIPEIFADKAYKIFTLVVSDDAVLKSRVLNETRDSGYRNWQAALAWNKRERERALLPNEVRIDTTGLAPERVVEEILGYLQAQKDQA